MELEKLSMTPVSAEHGNQGIKISIYQSTHRDM